MQLQCVVPGRHLPLRCITFVSEDVAICAGDDNVPMIFSNSSWWKLAQQQVLVLLMMASRDTTGNPRHPEAFFWKLPRDILLIIIGYVVGLTITRSGKEENCCHFTISGTPHGSDPNQWMLIHSIQPTPLTAHTQPIL